MVTTGMQKGDYVLATKYSDGDPQDHWAVGFYDREEGGRHYVVDGVGQQMRGNGFRRVAKISEARGAWLLQNARDIEQSGRSVWGWKRAPMTSNVAIERPSKRAKHACDGPSRMAC